ncbi:Phage-related protein [Cupriavidus basilensis]|uniref:Phage-related protein n=2 Tax=Cupriavidus basilensis TaxID=68895 RepID=A0A0C4Y9S3_9BURK|nr:Phage-related protein [Cupriavidus basilensis]
MKRQPYVSVSNPPRFSDVEAGDVFVCPDFAPTTSARGSVLAECERPGIYHCMGQKQFAEKHSPYGVPGDRLWVRETWNPRIVHSCFDMACDCETVRVEYQAGGDGKTFYGEKVADEWTMPQAAIKGRQVPSLHMPRWASRLLLEVTGVRVERLNDCSEADAIAEGIAPELDGWTDYGNPSCQMCVNPVDSYRTLWNSINGAGAWAANPWVWVVEFTQVRL